jgi:hypothetical protein
MNLERSEAVAKRYFEKDQEKREVRSFYNQVMAEFNNKCELMEQVKAKLEKEKATELREHWNMRSKFD